MANISLLFISNVRQQSCELQINLMLYLFLNFKQWANSSFVHNIVTTVVVSAFVFIVVATVPSFAAVVVVLNFKNKTEAKPLTFSFHDNRE